ncbi:Transcriptional regulator PadR-like family protein [compost metagenome]
MNTQDVILGLLCKEPRSGYDIKQHFEQYFSFFFDASYGTIYPTLTKMEGLELITKESIRQEGKPDKNVYTVTEKGKEHFREYLERAAEPELLRSDFLMHLYFGDMADPEAMNGIIRLALEEKKRMYDDLEDKYRKLDSVTGPYQKLCMELGLVQYKAFIVKLEEMLGKSGD